MYNRSYWLDHVTDQSGAVIQQGTLQDQAHFNNMEVGIADANIAAAILAEGYLRLSRVYGDIDKKIADEFARETANITDVDIATHVLTEGYLQLRRIQEHNDAEIFAEILGETHTVTLNNTKAYPFNSTVSVPTTVALKTNRRNLYYSVEANVIKVAGGLPGDIHITGKALNGFKVSFDGSAKSVTLELKIKGGMA